MKLIHPELFTSIEFKNNHIINIVFESPRDYSAYLSELYQQIIGNQGKWVLSENGKELKLDKLSQILIDPFSIDINNRKIISHIYNEISQEVNESEDLLGWNQLCTYLEKYMEDILKDSDIEMEYDIDIDIKDYLKLMNLKIVDNAENLSEKLIDYIKLYNSVMGTRLFVLVNIKNFLSFKELTYLYEQAIYLDCFLLLFEGNDDADKNNKERRLIIDKDSCIIE